MRSPALGGITAEDPSAMLRRDSNTFNDLTDGQSNFGWLNGALSNLGLATSAPE